MVGLEMTWVETKTPYENSRKEILLKILTSLTSEYQSFDLLCVELFPLKKN